MKKITSDNLAAVKESGLSDFLIAFNDEHLGAKICELDGSLVVAATLMGHGYRGYEIGVFLEKEDERKLVYVMKDDNGNLIYQPTSDTIYMVDPWDSTYDVLHPQLQ